MVTPAGSTTVTLSWRQDYSFDRFGNRNFVEANTTTIPRNCLDNQTPPNLTVCDEDRKAFNPNVNASNNRLSSSDGYQFDAAGNTVRDPQNRKFTYDAENKQTKVETVDANGTVTGTLGQYFYDGDGRRVKKIAWINGQWETTVFVYDASSRLVAEYSTILNRTPQVAYLTNDHLGSPRINTNENGAVISRHDYRPYGEEVSERTHAQYAGDRIRKQFTGYERDIETDLGADAPLMDQDENAPQSWNLFTYVRNSPLKFIDPTGNEADEPGFWEKFKNLFNWGIWGGEEDVQKMEDARRDWLVQNNFYQQAPDGTWYPIDATKMNRSAIWYWYNKFQNAIAYGRLTDLTAEQQVAGKL
ncbi:MAG: hypothetical protein IPJ30_02525 [Acidobacteria bacterium]|nr:hypothetical protein [Acidobacteriota bacterium]